jgi:hypothetical protein
MVVGSGLLARTFRQYVQNDRVIIFASGVSNSQQTEATEFEREKKLLGSFHNKKATLVYFSTVSVHDESLRGSAYIRHKCEMEKLVTKNFPSHFVFRLPILVGKTDNPFTLTNFLFHKIAHHQPIHVFKKACRYLMDADDVSMLLVKMIDSEQFINQTLDINFNNAIFISELIRIFEKVLRIRADTKMLDKGSCYTPNNQKFINVIDSVGFKLPANYEEQTISKYYSQRS